LAEDDKEIRAYVELLVHKEAERHTILRLNQLGDSDMGRGDRLARVENDIMQYRQKIISKRGRVTPLRMKRQEREGEDFSPHKTPKSIDTKPTPEHFKVQQRVRIDEPIRCGLNTEEDLPTKFSEEYGRELPVVPIRRLDE
jgi:CxxC motif-containing protein